MEVPPGILTQRILHNNSDTMIEFIWTPFADLERMYEGIQLHYDSEYERRKILVHIFKGFPTELLKEYIFKDQYPSIAEIQPLQLLDLT